MATAAGAYAWIPGAEPPSHGAAPGRRPPEDVGFCRSPPVPSASGYSESIPVDVVSSAATEDEGEARDISAATSAASSGEKSHVARPSALPGPASAEAVHTSLE